MRKSYALLIGILGLLVFTTCKQFRDDIDGYLSYWASEALIKSATIETASQNDQSGIASVASDKDAEITLRLHNPHGFQLVMPSATETRKIVDFAHLTDIQPVVGTDYEMRQSTPDTLQLIYKADFLKKAEWGEKDISANIALYAADGRPFQQTYTMKIKANTPPPRITHYSIAKTVGTPAYYALCFIVPEMDKKVPGGLLHKDIARIDINGSGSALSLNADQTAFVKPEGGAFADYADVTKLTEPDADDVPVNTASEWVLYYKTDVEVKDGSAKKDYTVRLADAKGLVAPVLKASTKPNKAEPVTLRITQGEKIDALSGDGSTETNAIVVKARTGDPEAQLEIKTPTAAALVYATLTEIASGSTSQYEGNPILVPLSINGANEKTFKLAYYTGGDGFKPAAIKTLYYKVGKTHTVTFNANGGAYTGGATATTRTALHGQKIPEPTAAEQPNNTGKTFASWCTDAAGTTAWNFATDTVTHDITLYAKWVAGTGTAYYKVEHYKQKLDGTYPATATETDTGLAGITGAPLSVGNGITLKTYPGFEFDTLEPASPTIAADGSTVVKVYYKQNVVTITLKVDGGTGGSLKGEYNGTSETASGNTPKNLTVPRGSTVSFTATPATGYAVHSWTGLTASPSTSTTATLAVTADTAVTVKFYQNTLDADDHPATQWLKLKELIAAAPDGGTLKIKGSITATNSGTNYGELIINKDLSIEGIGTNPTLDANKTTGSKPAHRIFKVASGKTLTLKNLTLKGGRVEAFGEPGGGAIDAEGTLTMTDCTVTDNRTEYGNGGGIYAAGALTMTSCTVSNNTVNDADSLGGGGIYAGSTLTMTNCTIKNNEATSSSGGGIYARSTLTMTNCTVAENTSKSSSSGAGSGGGIYAAGTLTMTGGAVTGNEAKSNGNGGGIYIGGAGSFIMTSGTVNNNKTEYGDGGGIYINTTGNLTMTDCTLTGNEAVNNKTGGGVYLKDGTFTMQGSSCVTPSTDNAKGNNDVYLADGKMITVDGVLSPAGGIAARITVGFTQYLSTTQVLDGSKVNTEYTKFTVTPKDLSGGITQQWNIKNNGFLQRPPVTISGSEGGAWKKLKTAVHAAEDGDIISISGTITATNTGSGSNANFGNIDIKKNITIEKAAGASSAVLNANRSSLSSNAHPIFRVSDGKTLKLKNLTLKGGKGTSGTFGGAINVTGGSSKTELEDCVIEDCEADKGGAIGCGSGTTVTLTNTTIQNCKTTGTNGTGGAIYTEGGTVTMTSGTLTGNTAKSGGGVYLKDGTFTMKGASCVTPSTGTEANEQGKNDVYLDSGKMITIDGELNPAGGIAARITVPNTKYAPTTQVLRAGSGVTLANERTKFNVTPKSGTPPEYWGINDTGNLTQDKAAILNTISKEQIQAAESSMNSTPITDRKTALEGKLILYKTNLNNYGIMRVTAVDNTGSGYIRIDYKTFNSDGSIKKSENNRKVNGTYSFDLDKGIDSGGDFDFWLENLNSTDAGRLFKPANGAKFYVLP
nr:right-handed parallel beta-helix repeat-containing protein [uncultured Treponema sp.]